MHLLNIQASGEEKACSFISAIPTTPHHHYWSFGSRSRIGFLSLFYFVSFHFFRLYPIGICIPLFCLSHLRTVAISCMNHDVYEHCFHNPYCTRVHPRPNDLFNVLFYVYYICIGNRLHLALSDIIPYFQFFAISVPIPLRHPGFPSWASLSSGG